MEKEFNLSEKFREERKKIIRGETIHCHVTINKIEEDVKEFIQRLKEDLTEKCWDNHPERISPDEIIDIVDKLAGEKLV